MILAEKQQKCQHYHEVKLKNKHEYFTGEEILTFDQRRVIEQAKFTYSPLGEGLEKQTKMIKNQGRKTNKSNWRSWKKIGWINVL